MSALYEDPILRAFPPLPTQPTASPQLPRSYRHGEMGPSLRPQAFSPQA